MNDEWPGNFAGNLASDFAAGEAAFVDDSDGEAVFVEDAADDADVGADTPDDAVFAGDAPDDVPRDEPVGGPSGWRAPEPTGVQAVDDALEPLLDLDQLATADHVGVYEHAHRKLQDALADLDGSTSGP